MMFFLQRAVQSVRGADQAEVSERLWKIAEMLACGPKFLRVESGVIGVAEHLFEDESALQWIARTRQAFRIPKRAHAESPFLSRQTVRSGMTDTVAMHQ